MQALLSDVTIEIDRVEIHSNLAKDDRFAISPSDAYRCEFIIVHVVVTLNLQVEKIRSGVQRRKFFQIRGLELSNDLYEPQL